MKAGDVIFVRGTSLISRLIRFFDKGQFSHVVIAISENQVIETNWNMRSKITDFKHTDYELVCLNLSDNQRQLIPDIARKYEGKRYDYLQILGYIFKRRLNNPRHLICSELVYSVLRDVGYMDDERLLDATPNELYTILNDKG